MEKIFETLSTPWIKHTVIVVLSIGVAIILSRIIRLLLNRFFKSSSDKLKVDATKFNFIKNAVSFLIYLAAIIVIFYSIPALRSLGVTLFAGAGIFAALLAFASQQAFSNIISGIFIVIFRPFRVGDNVKVANLYHGIVEDITLRHTVLKDFENRRIIIPNSIIGNESVVNSSISDEKMCNWVEFGIAYDADIDKAKAIIQEEAMKHPEFLDNRTPEEKKNKIEPVIVRLISLGDFAVTLRAYIWAKNSAAAFAMKCDLFQSVKKRFDNEGVEIPFPYRNIVLKNSKDTIQTK